MSTIFNRIIDGEIPCHKVFENEHVLAFLDIAPLCRGHTLVIPKEEAATLDALSPAAGAALGEALVLVSRAVAKATGTSDYNVLQNNGASAHQAVFHVHFHIIPKTEDGGLGVEWNTGELSNAEETAEAISLAIETA
ncbi:MAG: HIT family protein [Planctomycetota bacterium]|nr:HIT family protein [Planctomycetota bacterium]